MTMSTFIVKPVATSHEGILKFEANQFITQHISYEFENIEEAKISPLAQQLFHLPFVKQVFIAQNFVAINKYDIVAWEDVQDEVAKEIEAYLNSGAPVINATDTTTKKVPATVYAESTPNPGVLKFVANKKLVLNTVEFKNIDEAKDAPLAMELFKFPFVKEIFMDDNYVSITKFDYIEWNDITQELREFIRVYLEDAKPILADNFQKEQSKTPESDQAVTATENLDETSQLIIGIIDEYVKPAVASDGGNIQFISYEKETKKVDVLLQGACSGCPSSTITLKNGIENMLKEMLPGKVASVEAING